MNFAKATDEQLKNIIEWDIGIPTLLLKEVYEEVIKRRIMDSKIYGLIYKRFKSKENAENKTGLSTEDLLWICYEVGYECIDKYQTNHPFMAFWYTNSMNKLVDIIRESDAQKRKGEVFSLDGIYDWMVPASNNTESIALNRLYIESLMNQLTEVEKEIVIKRYQGYFLSEIGEIQGVTAMSINRRIRKIQKRLKGA